jgi:hypothetical protein
LCSTSSVCQRRTKNLPLGGAKVGHFDDLSSEL